MKRIVHLAIAALAAWTCGAADASSQARVTGPVAGYVWEAAGLRSILGIPGAAVLGAPALFEEAARLALSPRQNYALAVRAADGRLALLRLDGAERAFTAIEGATAGALRIVLSPSGTAAALLHDGGHVEIVRGLPDAPEPGTWMRLPAPVPAALAVSDDGQALLASLAQPAGLFLLTPDGDPRPLPFSGEASALAFAPGSRDAVIADRRNHLIALLRDTTGTPAVQILAGPAEGIAEPSAVAFLDRRRVAAAEPASGSLAILPLDGGAPALLACSCRPELLEQLNGPALFRVNRLTDGPLWLLDAGGPEPRMVFVPAPTAPEGAERTAAR